MTDNCAWSSMMKKSQSKTSKRKINIKEEEYIENIKFLIQPSIGTMPQKWVKSTFSMLFVEKVDFPGL